MPVENPNQQERCIQRVVVAEPCEATSGTGGVVKSGCAVRLLNPRLTNAASGNYDRLAVAIKPSLPWRLRPADPVMPLNIDQLRLLAPSAMTVYAAHKR